MASESAIIRQWARANSEHMVNNQGHITDFIIEKYRADADRWFAEQAHDFTFSSPIRRSA